MNSPRFSPYNVNQRGAINSEDDKNNHSNNSMLYEFTFRRFFDEAHSSENVLRSNENDSTSFSQFFQSITENEQPKSDEHKRNTPLSPSLTSMMANVTTSAHSLTDPKKHKPEINGVQTRCDLINDFLETTNQEIADENLNSFKSIFNKNNSSNQIFKPTSSNIQQPANQSSFFNKLANSNSGNNLNLNDLKENRNDDNKAPIFV